MRITFRQCRWCTRMKPPPRSHECNYKEGIRQLLKEGALAQMSLHVTANCPTHYLTIPIGQRVKVHVRSFVGEDDESRPVWEDVGIVPGTVVGLRKNRWWIVALDSPIRAGVCSDNGHGNRKWVDALVFARVIHGRDLEFLTEPLRQVKVEDYELRAPWAECLEWTCCECGDKVVMLCRPPSALGEVFPWGLPKSKRGEPPYAFYDDAHDEFRGWTQDHSGDTPKYRCGSCNEKRRKA